MGQHGLCCETGVGSVGGTYVKPKVRRLRVLIATKASSARRG